MEVGLFCYNSYMRTREVTAFLVGTAIFAVVPYFDPVLPDDWVNTMLPFLVGLGGAAAVGALVVLIAGRREAWRSAVASALAGAVISSLIYGIALKPLPGAGFDLGFMLSDALWVFVFSGPAALIGAVPVMLALDFTGFLRRRRAG